MRAYVRAAAQSPGPTVVVCGGFHAPALIEELHSGAASVPIWPQPPVPPEGTAETYLVPYSYARLDAFAGYQSGMPSPGYYEALAAGGPDGAADELLRRTANALRTAGIGVSTADLVATRVQAEGLARLRGHPRPLRFDLLDGLASALLKEAHDQPYPWDRRAFMHPRAHPMLAAIV